MRCKNPNSWGAKTPNPRGEKNPNPWGAKTPNPWGAKRPNPRGAKARNPCVQRCYPRGANPHPWGAKSTLPGVKPPKSPGIKAPTPRAANPPAPGRAKRGGCCGAHLHQPGEGLRVLPAQGISPGGGEEQGGTLPEGETAFEGGVLWAERSGRASGDPAIEGVPPGAGSSSRARGEPCLGKGCRMCPRMRMRMGMGIPPAALTEAGGGAAPSLLRPAAPAPPRSSRETFLPSGKRGSPWKLCSLFSCCQTSPSHSPSAATGTRRNDA